MSYLYGDSTSSPLEVNFIDFLGDCLDFCAKLLVSTESLRLESENGAALRRAADADTQRLERLALTISSAVNDLASSPGDDHTARCAVAIVRSSSDLVRTEIEQVSATLLAELAKVDATAASERNGCMKALEALLLRHDLPGTRRGLSIQAKAGAPYGARLRVSSGVGVAATLDLDVPASHLFGHALRVDRIIERLEVQAPDAGGWLHKEGKIRAQRFEKLYVVHVDLDLERSSIKLRSAADGTGPGFDVIFGPEEPRVTLLRAADRDAAGDQPFEVREADAVNLLKLLEKLEASATELVTHRKALLEASLDERPFAEHDQPSVLAERLVAAVAPVTQEIARRSPSTTELVLKRLVSGGRREEIFVTKAELLRRLDHLPTSLRSVFDPLGLADPIGGVMSTAAPRSMPSPAESPEPQGGGDPATLVMARRAGNSVPPNGQAAEPPGEG